MIYCPVGSCDPCSSGTCGTYTVSISTCVGAGVVGTFTNGATTLTATSVTCSSCYIGSAGAIGGRITVAFPNAGVWSYSLSKSHWVTKTGTITVTCSGIVQNVNVVMTPAAGWSCSQDPCCPNDTGIPWPVVTYPSTMTATDPFGAVTCAQDTSFPNLASYYGCAPRTFPTAWVCDPANPGTFMTATNVSCMVQFNAICIGTGGLGDPGSWQLILAVGRATCYDTLGARHCSPDPSTFLYYPGASSCPPDGICPLLGSIGLDLHGVNGSVCPSVSYSGTMTLQPWAFGIPGNISNLFYTLYGATPSFSVSS